MKILLAAARGMLVAGLALLGISVVVRRTLTRRKLPV